MNVLEQRYRRVLRLLPAPHRTVWEEEMVATFLESMTDGDPETDQWRADFARPSRAEVAAVATLAVRLRLGGAAAPARAFTIGQAVRTFALVGLLFHVLDLAIRAYQHLWIAADLPMDQEVAAALAADPVWDLSMLGDYLAGFVWVAAFVALLAGRSRAAQLLAAAGLATSVGLALMTTTSALMTTTSGQESGGWIFAVWVAVCVDVLIVAALAGFHRQAPPVQPGRWLIAAAVGMNLAAITAVSALVAPFTAPFPDRPALLCLIWAGAFLTYRACGRDRWALSSVLALALLAVPVLAMQLATQLAYLASPWGPRYVLWHETALAGMVAVLGLSLLVHTARRLPPPTTPPLTCP